MKRLLWAFLCLLLAAPWAAASAEEVYTTTVTKDMTIRATQSTSGKRLGGVEAGETIHILEYGGKWTLIAKDGVKGYVLSKNVVDLAAAGDYDDEATALYLGEASKQLSVRETRARSALKLQTIAEGETVYLLELGEEWHTVVKNGVLGYVLAEPVENIRPAREGIELPEGFAPFVAVYTARADVNLSIRWDQDEESRVIGTVYEDETVDVMEIDGAWARVRKGEADGYVLAEHLRYYRRYDPFGPTVPGVVVYPYAATALEDTDILDAESGELLRTVPAGAVMAVSALDGDMAVTLPYDRITGRIVATSHLDLRAVSGWEQAQSGDLISVFSTYYDPAQETPTQIGRLHNITQGVERLQNVVVPAGATFRFNDYCAPYTRANGYMEGPIINYVSSKKLGYGGGICQVSTTLYDAVLQIPIEIVKQQVHSSYGISYAPLDMDAAVGAGNLDLRLQNVLPYDVRFELQAVGGVLTVFVYRAS